MLPHSHLVLYCCIWKSTNHISQAPLPAALLLDSVIKRHLWDFKVRGNVTFSAFGLHSSRYYSFWNLLVMRGLWYGNYILSSVQLSHVQLFATPWIAARQDSLSITNSQSSLRLMSIESVMPSSSSVVPFSSCSQSLPASEFFPVSQLFTWGCQSTGVSALASFLPKKSQGWSPSEWTGWIALQSKGLSRVFSNTTLQKHQFFSAQPSSQSTHIHTWPQEKP